MRPASRRGGGVVGVAEVDGDAVGRLEADAVDLAGDAVGFVRDDLLRLGAVFVDELHALRGRDAVGLQEDVHLAEDVFCSSQACLDGGGADLADALDLCGACRIPR